MIQVEVRVALARHDACIRRTGELLALVNAEQPVPNQLAFSEDELKALDQFLTNLATKLLGATPGEDVWLSPSRYAFRSPWEKGGPGAWLEALNRGLIQSRAFFEAFQFRVNGPESVQTFQEEESMDPLSVITLISSGLKLVDQFRELAIRFRGGQPSPPGAKAEQAGSALEVSHGGVVTQKIEATELHMNEWDTTRFEALRKRIRTNWDIFNDLFTNEAGASLQEGARIRADMRKTQETLCQDFREMIGIYQRTLGASLPDHYQLYEVCGNEP
jgi:hypothetical protein